MSQNNNDDFLFFPRPEAKALQWKDLAAPVKSAVRTLLVMLAGAERQVEADPNVEVANCFLVNGERGTGKTSVLLNAREAIHIYKKPKLYENKENNKYLGWFFAEKEAEEGKEKTDAKKSADYLVGRVVWLDILDLEPLQPDTNLLTTVLTRIRSALPKTAEDQEYTSLFEAGDNSARSLLDQLIGDATLMWESIKDQDTRISANRQVHVAGIYANFKDSFSKALDKLTEELGRPYGHSQQRSIILPIDNIDRSTDHLQSIVKLAQLVAHPRLWLVMAGGREDVGTFLERAYWKELIRNSGGSMGISCQHMEPLQIVANTDQRPFPSHGLQSP